jgi:hypothetical protein
MHTVLYTNQQFLSLSVSITALAVLLMMVAGRFGWRSQHNSSSKPASGPAHSILPADTSCDGGAVPADAAVHLADGDAACKRWVQHAA